MSPVDASKGGKTNTLSTDERTNCFHSEDDQLNQEERRSTPYDVTKTNCYQ